jgi:hypothetical protein
LLYIIYCSCRPLCRAVAVAWLSKPRICRYLCTHISPCQ